MADETMTQEEASAAVEGMAQQLEADVTNVVEQTMNGDLTAILPLAEKYLLPVGTALLTIIIGYFVARFVARLASAPVRKRVDETIGRFVNKLVFYSIFIFTLLGVLGRFGISVASFAAVIAAAGFAVGLAFQGTLSNFAAGVLLLVFRPFKVGDFVNAAGVSGTVTEIDLFTTALDTPDNRRIIVPNSSISNAVIENLTYHKERRVDVTVGVDYSASIKATRSSLVQAVEKLGDKVISGDSRGHAVVLGELGDSAVTWHVRVWTEVSQFFAVKEELIENIKNGLDKESIGIPYPQLDVHIISNEQRFLKKTAN